MILGSIVFESSWYRHSTASQILYIRAQLTSSLTNKEGFQIHKQPKNVHMINHSLYFILTWRVLLIELRLIWIWTRFTSFAFIHTLKREVRWMKVSSLQGIVIPPIGWSYPNSSSAWLSKSKNKGSFKYDIGTTNRFFWLSPTYTAK